MHATRDSWLLLGCPQPLTVGFACRVMLCGLLQLQGSIGLMPHDLHAGYVPKALLMACRPHWTRSNREVAILISVSDIFHIPCHHKDTDHRSCPFQPLFMAYNPCGCWLLNLMAAFCEQQGSVGDPCTRGRYLAALSQVSIFGFSNSENKNINIYVEMQVFGQEPPDHQGQISAITGVIYLSQCKLLYPCRNWTTSLCLSIPTS